jgi:hypothetical protein
VPWRWRRRRVGIISDLSLPHLDGNLLVGGERLWAVVPSVVGTAAVRTMVRGLVLRFRCHSDAASNVGVEFVGSLVQEVAGSGCSLKWRTRRWHTRCDVCGMRPRRSSSASAAVGGRVGTTGVPWWSPGSKPQRKRPFGPLQRSPKAQMRDEATPVLGVMVALVLLRRRSDGEGDHRQAMELCAEDPRGVCVIFLCFGVFFAFVLGHLSPLLCIWCVRFCSSFVL